MLVKHLLGTPLGKGSTAPRFPMLDSRIPVCNMGGVEQGKQGKQGEWPTRTEGKGRQANKDRKEKRQARALFDAFSGTAGREPPNKRTSGQRKGPKGFPWGLVKRTTSAPTMGEGRQDEAKSKH